MKRIFGSFFVIDQAVSSLITFVLIAALAKSGGVALVGSVAILQTIALAGLAASRAIGVDVWAAAGAPPEQRRWALSSSVFVAFLVLTVNVIPFLISGANTAVGLYWIVTPLIVMLDAVRIMLLHANRTWISVAAQSATLFALIGALATSAGVTPILLAYLAGTFLTVSVGYLGLKILPPLPSISYALRNRYDAGPFLFEVSLGSITQQLLFMLLAVCSTVETAGQIRIAQTLLGPMSVIHSGLAPQLLRRIGRMSHSSKRTIAGVGRRFGVSLAAYSMAGAVILSLGLSIEVSGFSILELFLGHRDLGIPPIVGICGVALACGALILGTGTSARILGITKQMNQWRLLLIIPQVCIVIGASLADSPLLAAGGLAGAAAATALMSIVILMKHVGRKGRRARLE